ncbi:hypothetical protein GWO43_20245 [candidate division KSB1 bacterium]|nr:hypothetical protein [candidate division KSB1 bacterium]NIR71725.1 hypothetical protein [candidate division KSB1 bacterium]NIS26406.1 hypothetical protein [candidate division KSB1 bacterium]NIT73165.1 hypothetical protein [candidate division KSB1 bacterium]NIU27092.1 hypothetical protein [candidate division KSB1 bacterium]
MSKKLVVKKNIELDAHISKVWDALTNPELTKQYFFGCEAMSDWKPESPIVFKQVAEGKDIVQVKGVITNIEPQKVLQHTCLTPEFEDDPSKHTTVTYELSSNEGRTQLSITQGDFGEDETRYNHTAAGWDHVLNGLKTVVENQ